jgi:hypothetical protein
MHIAGFYLKTSGIVENPNLFGKVNAHTNIENNQKQVHTEKLPP